ncbi:hypothetical protein PENANT_c013G08507 [Penicillium antarcticum]|uniref:Uncharacterized protein n=1 Tax=Penicillium antarcticum TaxID=416450 RepID=A0A1V6Q5P6_9EURO|nr:hypothetical protein PENANT_c013G08507 [Penicillium antarcticum]
MQGHLCSIDEASNSSSIDSLTMDKTENRSSIVKRQPKLLGNFQFQAPVTQSRRGLTARTQKVPPSKKREQVLRAQRL